MDDALGELWSEFADVSIALSRKLSPTNIGSFLNILDQLIEAGELSAEEIHNKKLMARIDFGVRRQYNHERKVVLANYQAPVSHYSQ